MGQRPFPSPLMGCEISARVLIESQYRHLLPSPVSETQIFSVSVSVSSLRLGFFSLGLVIDTHIFLVSVSVSSLRLTYFQSWSWSRHWDLDISVSASLLRLRHFQSRSCHWDSHIFSLGLGLADQNLVSLISFGLFLLLRTFLFGMLPSLPK